jgi:hypothetical protein
MASQPDHQSASVTCTIHLLAPQLSLPLADALPGCQACLLEPGFLDFVGQVERVWDRMADAAQRVLGEERHAAAPPPGQRATRK